jgi:flagellar basal body-associated protein FliL
VRPPAQAAASKAEAEEEAEAPSKMAWIIFGVLLVLLLAALSFLIYTLAFQAPSA